MLQVPNRLGRPAPVPAKAVTEIISVRALNKDDLEKLQEKREPVTSPMVRIRDSHHMLARMLAAGMTTAEIARRGLYSTTRIGMLRRDPTFQELIEHYRAKIDESFLRNIDEFFDIATSNMLRAERMIADRLEDIEEDPDAKPIPLRDLMAISRDAADRFGYGKKQTNVNVNLDFASKLERAVKRSAQAQGKTIEAGTAQPVSAEAVAGVPASAASSGEVSIHPPPRNSLRRF